MPVCNTCGEDKPETEFYLRSDSGKPRGDCKKCNNSKSLAYYGAHTEQHAAAMSARYRTHGRFRRYGITQERYEQALREQDGNCKLCGVSEPGGKGVWHIDHAHDPGKTTVSNGGFNQTDDPSLFRGLLCHRCNISLGHYELLVERIGEDKLMRYLHPGMAAFDNAARTLLQNAQAAARINRLFREPHGHN